MEMDGIGPRTLTMSALNMRGITDLCAITSELV
jgi:hypothetical protein